MSTKHFFSTAATSFLHRSALAHGSQTISLVPTELVCALGATQTENELPFNDSAASRLLRLRQIRGKYPLYLVIPSVLLMPMRYIFMDQFVALRLVQT